VTDDNLHLSGLLESPRVAKIKAVEDANPSCKDLGYDALGDVPPQFYPCHRPTASGRRVVRKSEPMAG
jgi:hypothetical protein